MTLVEFAQNLLGSSSDPVIQIFTLASGLIVVSTFMTGFIGAIFNFFRK